MKYTYKLNNLTCPNCAKKIEDTLNKNDKIIKANLNFAKLTLTIESNEPDILNIVRNTVKNIEPDVIISDTNDKKINYVKYDLLRLISGIILALIGTFLIKKEIFIILSYVILLSKTTLRAIKLFINTKSINETLLITISCIGAYFTNNIHEGLMVIILYEIGKILENIAVNNSRKSITDLMNIKPIYANLYQNEKITKIDPDSVKINDIILVKVGEIIPLDGIIIKGNSQLDTSSLTGESDLKKVKEQDKVLSGSINTKNILEIKVTSTYQDSTVSKILNLVENATDRKAKTENIVAKIAKVYTPIILLLAIITAISLPLITDLTYNESLYRALTFLVISCPCAIAISVPLSYFSGIGASSKEGILIKGSDYLDALGKINKIIFDKTGTLTSGNVKEYNLIILDKNYSKDTIINYYLSGESLSNHPVAKSILSIFSDHKISKNKIIDFKEISGKGIEFKIDNKQIKIGSYSFCQSNINDDYIYLNIDNKNIAKLKLFDGIKENAKDTIKALKELNIKPMMYTGDTKDKAISLSSYLNINDVKYELLPQDKYNLLEKELKQNKGIIAFVGDGINDAPSLKRADLGISMGSIGSQSAIEASDIVIMKDDLNKIITGIKISKFTTKIIKQNLFFALGIKILVLILSIFGITSMYQAVFADTGLTLLTILNTTRILKKKFK